MAYLDAKEQAAKYLMQNAGGDYRPDPDAERFPASEILTTKAKVPAIEMFDRYGSAAIVALTARAARPSYSRAAITLSY